MGGAWEKWSWQRERGPQKREAHSFHTAKVHPGAVVMTTLFTWPENLASSSRHRMARLMSWPVAVRSFTPLARGHLRRLRAHSLWPSVSSWDKQGVCVLLFPPLQCLRTKIRLWSSWSTRAKGSCTITSASGGASARGRPGTSSGRSSPPCTIVTRYGAWPHVGGRDASCLFVCFTS